MRLNLHQWVTKSNSDSNGQLREYFTAGIPREDFIKRLQPVLREQATLESTPDPVIAAHIPEIRDAMPGDGENAVTTSPVILGEPSEDSGETNPVDQRHTVQGQISDRRTRMDALRGEGDVQKVKMSRQI